METTTAFADAMEDRLCWGQPCVRRLASGQTLIGALHMGEDVRAKFCSMWHVGHEHTMTVKKTELAETKASADCAYASNRS